MNENYDPNNPSSVLWRPHVPSPYVTHQDLAPMHKQIGSLEQGQQAIVSSYNHIRGEMLHGFDEIKAILRAQAEPQEPEKSEPAGIKLDRTNFSIFALSMMMLGALIGRPLLTFLGVN